ncbi:MAG: Fic family protein [Verrucomicrobia bacterium]|nr:Fic family protein [Verrucomicrobiota bacterium]
MAAGKLYSIPGSGQYVAALEHGIERLKTLPLSLRLVRELHEKLMAGVRGGQATPGEFRGAQNWIGPPGATLNQASYVPPPAEALADQLANWERFLHNRTQPPLIHAALAHYQFEAIHPFLDGNGRVGRLLITLLLDEREILPAPLLYLSAFFEATRTDYHAHLRNVTELADWEGWLQYFLNGVARQSEDALNRAERLNELLEQWRIKLAGIPNTQVALRLIACLGANPFVTPRGAEGHLGLAYNTVMRAIRQLQERKILSLVSEVKRGRVFCARPLLDILEEPARLTPGRL